MYRFLSIFFSFNGPPRVKDLEPHVTEVGDWLRFNNYIWIVWTTKTAGEAFPILAAHISKDDQMMIVEINMNERHGWVPKWIWDWIDVRRGIPRNYLAEILRQLPPPPGGG